MQLFILIDGMIISALPFALFFVDFKTALILVAISHIFGNLGRIKFFSQGLNKNILITFGISSVILSFVGSLFVQLLPQNTLKSILGFFLIMILFIFNTPWTRVFIKYKNHDSWGKYFRFYYDW